MINSAIAALSEATETRTKHEIKGSILYTTLCPANHDVQLLVEYGIIEVVFIDDVFREYNFMKASKRIMKKTNIKLRYILLFYISYNSSITTFVYSIGESIRTLYKAHLQTTTSS